MLWIPQCKAVFHSHWKTLLHLSNAIIASSEAGPDIFEGENSLLRFGYSGNCAEEIKHLLARRDTHLQIC